MYMSKIFIYGSPGSGKTVFSQRLEEKLHHQLIEADYLRKVAQKEKTQQEDPFVYVGTKDAWRSIGSLTKQNVLTGLFAVRKSMQPYVFKELTSHTDDLILEGSFLDPKEMKKYGKVFLLVSSIDEQYKTQYFTHRRLIEKQFEEFEAAKILREYFIEEAKKENVSIIENNGNLDELTHTFIKSL